MAVIPLKDYLYILPMKDPSDIGKIHSEADRKVDQGIVKYRGPKTTGEVRVGDHVFFSHWAGKEVVLEEEGTLIIIREPEIDLKVDESPFSHVLTIPQVGEFIRRTVAELCRRNDVTDHERELYAKFLERMQENLDARFHKEMYF